MFTHESESTWLVIMGSATGRCIGDIVPPLLRPRFYSGVQWRWCTVLSLGCIVVFIRVILWFICYSILYWWLNTGPEVKFPDFYRQQQKTYSKLVQGFRRSDTSDFAIHYRISWLSLEQCKYYRAINMIVDIVLSFDVWFVIVTMSLVSRSHLVCIKYCSFGFYHV